MLVYTSARNTRRRNRPFYRRGRIWWRRPASRKVNLASDFEWCFAKELLVGEVGMKAGDAEHHIAKVFATNFTYVTENIRRAKHFIELLENKGHVVARPTIDGFAKKYPDLFSDL